MGGGHDAWLFSQTYDSEVKVTKIDILDLWLETSYYDLGFKNWYEMLVKAMERIAMNIAPIYDCTQLNVKHWKEWYELMDRLSRYENRGLILPIKK